MDIVFSLSILPVAKGRPRFSFTGKCYTPEKTREYEQRLRQLLAFQKRKFKTEFLKPMAISMNFFLTRPKSSKLEYPSVKPDVDNYAKAVLDAMNGILFKDDGQIISLSINKRYHPAAPGIDINITSYDEPIAGKKK